MSLPDRVFLTVMDSVGIGELPDAHLYGDQGSDTLGNISRRVALKLPTLRRLGLARVANVAGMAPDDPEWAPIGAYGRMAERSAGKDSVTGHWEMAGIVLDRAFPTFPDGFPAEVVAEFERRIGR
jgi:phosphopentomutase